MTAFDPRSKDYFMRISTVVSVLKGGKYSLRYLHRKQLNEKYEIYRQTIKQSKIAIFFTIFTMLYF